MNPSQEYTSVQTVDCSRYFGALPAMVRIHQSVKITLSDHAYLPNGELEHGWLPLSLNAFMKMSKRDENGRDFESICFIGIGAGVDALVAVELLHPQRLVLTDLHEDVINMALSNIQRNCHPFAVPQIDRFISDVCSGVISLGDKHDLICENLPNLPANDSASLYQGSTTASFFDSARYDEIPARYGDDFLSLHYTFLKQARECLSKDGSVMCCIGIRVPYATVLSMFRDLHYEVDVLSCGLVVQLNTDNVLQGYATAEAAGHAPFAFYPYREASALLASRRTADSGIEELVELLKPLKVSAAEAVRATSNGTEVCHIGAVFSGRPIKEA